MTKIFIHADHWLYDDEEKMFPEDDRKKLHQYIDWLIKKGYIIRCIRKVEV